MSDLYIEARLQAIKDIASASCSDIKDADNIAGFCDEIYSAIPKLDKIIEELELHSFELGTDTLPVHYVRLNEAIEIVKQGGVSDASDNVCEWKLEDEEANLYLTGCQQRQLIFEGSPKENGYTYCPYCGKKIKVVEQMDEEDFCYCLDYMECEECPYYYADEDQEVE